MISALAIGAAVPALMGGCAAAGPSVSDVRERVRVAVEQIDGIDGALVSASSTGVDAMSIRLQLYVTDSASVETVLDSALEASWRAVTRQPDHISVSALVGPMPDGAIIGSLDGLDLLPSAAALGFEGVRSSMGVVIITDSSLAARYGAWVKPANE